MFDVSIEEITVENDALYRFLEVLQNAIFCINVLMRNN